MEQTNEEIAEKVAMFLRPDLFDPEDPNQWRPGPTAERESVRAVGHKLVPLIRSFMEEA